MIMQQIETTTQTILTLPQMIREIKEKLPQLELAAELRKLPGEVENESL